MPLTPTAHMCGMAISGRLWRMRSDSAVESVLNRTRPPLGMVDSSHTASRTTPLARSGRRRKAPLFSLNQGRP
jgi:hypothetical protein